MDIGNRNSDMLRARQDHPTWLDPTQDEPIEDQQVNDVEYGKDTESVGKQVPEGVTSQGRGSPKQCRTKGSPDEQSEKDSHAPFLPGSRRHDLSDLLRIMA